MRAAEHETLRLNHWKVAACTAAALAYAKEKSWALILLAWAHVNWSDLDRAGRHLRGEVPYAHTLPVHGHDQAAFAARNSVIHAPGRACWRKANRAGNLGPPASTRGSRAEKPTRSDRSRPFVGSACVHSGLARVKEPWL